MIPGSGENGNEENKQQVSGVEVHGEIFLAMFLWLADAIGDEYV